MAKPIVVASIVVISAVVVPVRGADVILNEYNAVDDLLFLEGTASDPFWGRRQGNGDDWFELVVITDHLDMRGWDLVMTNCTGCIPPDGVQETFVLTLTNDPIWYDLRSGTIITVSEELSANVDDYRPVVGQWWINVHAADGTSGTYITPMNFKVSNNNWQLTIRNALDQTIFGPAGEGINPPSGVGNDEVCKLEQDPSAAVTPLSAYNDGASSTFGSANEWSGGAGVQDFSALRSGITYSPLTTVRINELMTHTDLPQEDWIELYNTSDAPIDISGWYLSDDVRDARTCVGGDLPGAACDGDENCTGTPPTPNGTCRHVLMQYEIPAGTVLAPGGYEVFYEHELPFALSSTGEQLALSVGDGAGGMTGERDFAVFGAIENGRTFGRVPNGTNKLYRLEAPTPYGPNAAPVIGPVVINEVMYNPVPGPIALPSPEYIELHNTSDAPVDLFHDYGALGVHPWRLSDAVTFAFSTTTTIPAGGFLLVVNFDPNLQPAQLNEFRNVYGLDESVAIVGPYAGALNNFSDTVRLRMPDTPDSPFSGPLILVDEVTYFDFGDWPTEPDGTGPSLERIVPDAVGDVATNWAASLSAGGTPGRLNSVTADIPAVSTWGMVVLMLAVVAVGTIRFRACRALFGGGCTG